MANRRCVAKLARTGISRTPCDLLARRIGNRVQLRGHASGQLTIVPLGSGDPRSIPWPVNLKMAAVHPSGRAVVVVDERNRLSVLDLPSGQIERTLFVGGVRIPIEAQVLLGNDYPRDWLTMPLDAIEDLLAESEMRSPRPTGELCAAVRPRARLDGAGIPNTIGRVGQRDDRGGRARTHRAIEQGAEALAATREPGWLEEKSRSREWVHQLGFDPAGERLFAATEGGLRVYLWRECMEASAEMPPPILAVDAEDRFTRRPTASSASAARSRPSPTTRTATGSCSAAPTAVVRYLDLAVGRIRYLARAARPPADPAVGVVARSDRSGRRLRHRHDRGRLCSADALLGRGSILGLSGVLRTGG